MTRLCSVPGCGRPCDSHSLCSTHLYRSRHGIRLALPIRQQPVRCCADCVPPCPRPSFRRGLCVAHYQRWCKGTALDTPIARRSDSPDDATRSRRAPSARAIDYAVALLSDPYCIYTPEEAWARACETEGLSRSAIPPEVLAAVAQRPSRRDSLDAISERHAIDTVAEHEVVR